MTALLDTVTAVTIATLATFGWALVSLRRLKVGRRPRITVYSRTGHPIAVEELNPPDQPRRSD
jgi:hypothetical protein